MDLPPRGPARPAADVDVLAGVNPGFERGDTRLLVNCTFCVQAHEYRARGYDVRARLATSEMVRAGGRSRSDWLTDWRHDDGAPVTVADLEFVGHEKVLRAVLDVMPDGARSAVEVGWRGDSWHLLLAEKTREGIRLLDGQAGRDVTDDPRYFRFAVPGRMRILRLDSLVATSLERTCRW